MLAVDEVDVVFIELPDSVPVAVEPVAAAPVALVEVVVVDAAPVVSYDEVLAVLLEP